MLCRNGSRHRRILRRKRLTTGNIHFMHRLTEVCVRYCKEQEYKFLTVKTLDESAVYEPYNATRAFYKKEGFYPLEVFTCVWDEENPCLFMVKEI